MSETSIRDCQSEIDGKIVAQMIIEFHEHLRHSYPRDVMTSSLCAVGPLQTMIGLAIKHGHLSLPIPPTKGTTP